MLERTTTIHALLADFPGLASFLVARHPAFARLADPSAWRRWARVATVGDVAVEMNVPWPDLLREIQAEIRRTTGAEPAIADSAPVVRPRLRDDVDALVRELEGGAPIATVAARLDALTPGLDADAVAALVGEEDEGGAAGHSADLASQVTDDLAGAPVAMQPGHSVTALRRECDRLVGLAELVEEIVDGLGSPPDGSRLSEARAPLLGLLDRLGDLDRQARRLRLAWYATVTSRVGPSLATMVSERIAAALEALRILSLAVSGDDPATVLDRTRTFVAALRRALATEEELLVPVACRAFDDDDWEAVAEQERVIGWALEPRQAL